MDTRKKVISAKEAVNKGWSIGRWVQKEYNEKIVKERNLRRNALSRKNREQSN